MTDINIILAALWVALMLVYLLGDVLRIFAGDFKAGEIAGVRVSQGMWLFLAAFMLIPIVMSYLSLSLSNPVNRGANLIAAAVLFLFNLVGLPSYPAAYDKFLIVVGLGINALTMWHAWRWA